MGWREDLSVLRHRSVRAFLAARFTSMLGGSIAPIALAFAVLDVSDSAAALGVVLAARSIPNVLFMLIGGVVADRLPRHLVLVAANSLCALTQAIAATLLVTGNAQIWQLVALEALNGVAAAFLFPAQTGVLPALVDREELPQANALAGFIRSTALIGGGAIAGVIVGFAGPAAGLYIDAATFVIAAARTHRQLDADRPARRLDRVRVPAVGLGDRGRVRADQRDLGGMLADARAGDRRRHLRPRRVGYR